MTILFARRIGVLQWVYDLNQWRWGVMWDVAPVSAIQWKSALSWSGEDSEEGLAWEFLAKSMDLREDMLREKFDLLIAREHGWFERNCVEMLLVMHKFGLQSCGLNGLETSKKQQVCSDMQKWWIARDPAMRSARILYSESTVWGEARVWSLIQIVQESGEKMARLLMGEDADEDVQFLGQFWCDRAEIWMADSVRDSASVFQISKRSDAKWA